MLRRGYAGLLLLILVLSGWAFLALPAPDDGKAGLKARQIGPRRGHLLLSSDIWHLSRQYESMTGPDSEIRQIRLSDRPEDADRVFWLKSLQVRVQKVDGGASAQPFFCHANLALKGDQSRPNQPFEQTSHLDDRLFTLIEGRLDLHLPDGFAIPIRGDAELGLDLMSRDLTYAQRRKPTDVRAEARLDFSTVPEEDDGTPLKPLFRRALYVFDRKRLRNVPGAAELAVPLLGEEACGRSDLPAGTQGVAVDRRGLDAVRKSPIHWWVPPGRHVYEIEIQDQLDLPFDTTAHYITGHFHTHGQWIRLLDAQSGKELVRIDGQPFPDQPGIAVVSDVASRSGIPLRKSGRYKLQVMYDNPTDHPIDAMGILYVYLLDQPQFR